MQTGLKEATEKMTAVTERLDSAEKTMQARSASPQQNTRTPRRKRRPPHNAYDGDTEESPAGRRGPKTQIVNQFHVSCHIFISRPI